MIIALQDNKVYSDLLILVLLTSSSKSIFFLLLLLVKDKGMLFRLTSIMVVLFNALIKDLVS